MRKLFLAILLTAATSCADTLDNATVTVTASRTVTQQPDQASLYVSLVTAPAAGLDDVLAKLKGTGITAEHLQGVSPAYGSAIPGGVLNPALSIWTFVVPVQFSKLKEILSALITLQASLGTVQGSNALMFQVLGASISQSAQAAQQCPLTALVADARRQADSMAAAAGMKAGAIMSVSDNPGLDLVPIAVPTARIGVYSYSLGGIGTTLPVNFLSGIIYSSPAIGTTEAPCSLTVQFKLQP